MTCASERAAARCAGEAPDVVLQNTQILVCRPSVLALCIVFLLESLLAESKR